MIIYGETKQPEELRKYLLNRKPLVEILGTRWVFNTVRVDGSHLEIYVNKLDDVDEELISFTDMIHIDGKIPLVDISLTSPTAVIDHLVQEKLLNRLVGIFERVEGLSFESQLLAPALAPAVSLRILANMKVSNFERFKEMVEEIAREATTFAVAHSLTSK